MTLNRKFPREAHKALFPSAERRDAAFAALEKDFLDIHIQKVGETGILVNLTDSKIYDLHIGQKLEALGGSWVPVGA